jgi:uncharacterized membrane protein
MKALTWETSGILTFAAIGLLLGNAIETLKLGLVYFPLHTGMYFGHERLWKHIKWGHKVEPIVLYPTYQVVHYPCLLCRPWHPND